MKVKETVLALLMLASVTWVATACAGSPASPSPARSALCGDGVCDEFEQANPQLCPEDCPVGEAAQPQDPPSSEPPTSTPPPPSPTPTALPPSPTPTLPSCGDGVCDEMEQANPDLCPQDCPAATAQVEVTVTMAEETPTPGQEGAPTPVMVVEGWQPVALPSGEMGHLGDPDTIDQETGGTGAGQQANVTFILDASGSMNAELPGAGQTRLAVAKQAMAALIPQVPAEVQGALWIYGHRFPQEPKDQSCQDIEQVFPLAPVDSATYIDRISAITAIGYTPIADSIEQAARDLPVDDVNSIILVSDGEETCGGDPCGLAEALKASDVALTTHVVGYAVDQVAREQLQCIATVSGGTYHDAEGADDLLQALQEALEATVSETILRVEVLAPDGSQVHQNLGLYDAGSDRPVSVYVAWKDNAVPPGSYDLTIDTLPSILYQGLDLPEGSNTVVRLMLGVLRALTPEGEQVAAAVFDAATDQELGYYGHDGPVLLAPGTYRLGVNNSTSEPVVIDAGGTTDVLLGEISVLTHEGEAISTDIYDQNTGYRLGYYGGDGPVHLVAGTYQVRVNNSASAPLDVEPGQVTEVQLGAITILDLAGQEIAADIYDQGTGIRLGYYGGDGPVPLVAGAYRVVAGERIFDNVIVQVGEVTVLQ